MISLEFLREIYSAEAKSRFAVSIIILYDRHIQTTDEFATNTYDPLKGWSSVKTPILLYAN